MIAWFTGKRILGSGSPTMWRKYPFFVIAPETKDVPRLAKRAASEFGVQLLVASKKKCGAENAKALNMGSAKKIFENDCYYVFKLRTKND